MQKKTKGIFPCQYIVPSVSSSINSLTDNFWKHRTTIILWPSCFQQIWPKLTRQWKSDGQPAGLILHKKLKKCSAQCRYFGKLQNWVKSTCEITTLWLNTADRRTLRHRMTQEFCELGGLEITSYWKGLCKQAALNFHQLLCVCSKVRHQGKVKGETQNS